MPMILSSYDHRHRLIRSIIVALAICAPFGVRSESDTGHDLDVYVGGNVSEIEQDFGEPTLKSPNVWWYSRKRRVTGGMPGAPNPAIVGGRAGVTVRGAGGDYEPLRFDADPCEVTITLDKSQSVETIETAGPGCFEYLHELKRGAAPDS